MNLESSESYTIIGTGFGLYGYLPALIVLLDKEVILPISYKTKVDVRDELLKISGNITWVNDQDTALRGASGLIIATQPTFQEECLNKYISLTNLKKIIIEKPIAVTPQKSIELLTRLETLFKKYLISYSFLHISWYKSLRWPTNTHQTIKLSWTFMAHHFKNNIYNWKRFHDQGGGVLRFYGIHIIAMLADLGYTSVNSSLVSGRITNEPDYWGAVFSGHALPDCELHLDSRASLDSFSIGYADDTPIIKLSDPFNHEVSLEGFDSRINVLANEIRSLESNSETYSKTYGYINQLWALIEQKTIMQYNNEY
jgi:hypothetical protein